MVQIFGKHADCLFAGILKQLAEGLIFHAGGNQPLPAIGARLRHRPPAGIVGSHGFAADRLQRFFLLQHNSGFQEALFFTPVQCQYAVRSNAADRLLKIIVHFIGGILGAVAGGGHNCRTVDQQTQCLADLPIIGDVLRQNIHCAGKCISCGFYALFWVNIFFRHGKRLLQRILGADRRCQRLQSFFPCNAAAGSALRLVGAVKILHLRQRACRVDGGFQLRRQLFLLGNGAQHLFPPLLQIAQVFQPVAEIPQCGII